MIKHKKQNTYKSFIQTRIAWSEVKKLFILPIILVLVACQTGPTVDGSDEKSFDTSMATIKGTLDKKDHEKLEKIMKGVEYLYSDNIISALNASAAIKNRIRTRLDGMNATEIFEEWNDRVDKAIRKLEEKKNNTETAMENQKDVFIRRAEFYRQRGQSVVKLTVENKTEHAIGKVYFRGTLRRRETRKWILHRISAIILAPIYVWLYFSLISLSTKNYSEAIYFFKNPLFGILTIVVFFVGFFHAKISLNEIFEDYIHDEKIKNVANLLALLLSIIIPLITIVLLLYKLQ